MDLLEIEKMCECNNGILFTNEFGVKFTSEDTVSFTMWAPLAYKVELLLFRRYNSILKEPSKVILMDALDCGVWQKENVNCNDLFYYKYRIYNKLSDGTEDVNEVCDIWAKSASQDSLASQIVDISDGFTAVPTRSVEVYDKSIKSYVNPWKEKDYTRSLIYELHVRDWSLVEDPQSTGKFLDLAEGIKVVKYIKSLGVTHVQLMPCFDYAQTDDDPGYNWGYNPYNYNVPESRYVRRMKDGTDAVKQFRTLVQKFHKAGIAVNMDVVYNHTNATGKGSLYDMTAPGYFYRLNEDGSFSNGTGCGNEVATEHKMVRYFVLDSLKHWMLNYHINGFRFDLMGCQETDFMGEVYAELSKIDSSVMVYGEPWTAGPCLVKSGVCKENIDTCEPSLEHNGVACFNDNFRDAIKGAEFMRFKAGQVQGEYADEEICKGLCGSKNLTNRIGRMINYVECHDNFTLFDKLSLCVLGKSSYSGNFLEVLNKASLEEVKKQDKLSASYVLLAQGTPFLHSGQEFLRTKRGNDNSYIAGDLVNKIDFSMREQFSDVYFCYKGLIALRKEYPEAFGCNANATAETLEAGVTLYKTGDFMVIFNATSKDLSIEYTGYGSVVDVSTGAPRFKKNMPSLVEAKSFLILKR